jgi:hypothetical protein
MMLHQGTLYIVSKRVNDGRWLQYNSTDTREKAVALIDYATALHVERCPKDRVEFSIQKVY